jgi:imidazolonepropionase-like amidohydrolase
VIKVPLGEAPVLDDATLAAVVARAHDANVKVVAHALSDEVAARAATAGVDALAHTPTQPLADSTLSAWQGRAVITTLSAFGGAAARANLAALKARGATVLYGTDFGNTSIAGISAAEIDALSAAGMSGSAILASATSAPADFFGFDGLGRIEKSARACLLVLDENPLAVPRTLSTPLEVYRDGALL